LDKAFRNANPAVLGRIQDNTYKLDLRTIGAEEIPSLVKTYADIVKDYHSESDSE
jgi:hypothetical protein